MPSRQLPPPPLPPSPSPQPPPPLLHHQQTATLSGGVSVVAAFSLLISLTLCFRKFSHKRTVPSDSKPPHRFSYSALRQATSSFSPSNRLGQGGFGSVYRGTLTNNQHVAVKSMDAGSLQGEREFQNELFLAGKIDSDRIVSLIGFSSDHRRRRMLLVYELMSNGSLQHCLLHRKCEELKVWNKRHSIALDVAKGIEYLHHYCDPPIIHGDIKPSNVLLDQTFCAKIGDFGLARLKSEDQSRIALSSKIEAGKLEDNRSVCEETESLATTILFDEFSVVVDQSPESFVKVIVPELSPEMVTNPEASPGTGGMGEGLEKASATRGDFDVVSVESGGENLSVTGSLKKKGKAKRSVSGKDWWWKQETNVSESGRVKDYVMEWIGSEIKKERPKSEWIATGDEVGASSSSVSVAKEKKKKKKKKKRLDWWVSLDEDKNAKKLKRRPAREWWKEEYSEELERKKKKKKKKQGLESARSDINKDNWWPKDDGLYVDRKKKRSRSSSRGSVDWWLDGLSGELWKARRNSHDSVSGEIPKSGGISSTPSMRGTVCYIAPEYSRGGDLSEKCDVYSFGVLLLVLIAGRRPLQVSGSPMSEFQRANLLSWARHLARAGKLLDLVDKSIQCVDREQCLLCIVVALLCLQKTPELRPSMKEVVSMLSGDLEPPQLPVEFSPSPPSRFKSHKKGR